MRIYAWQDATQVFSLFAVDLPVITVNFASFYRDPGNQVSRRPILNYNPSGEIFIDADEKYTKFLDYCSYRPR